MDSITEVGNAKAKEKGELVLGEVSLKNQRYSWCPHKVSSRLVLLLRIPIMDVSMEFLVDYPTK